MLFILIVLEKRPADALKMSRKDVRRVTSLGRPQSVNFEPLVKCIFIALFSILLHQMCAWNTKEFLGFWRNFPKTSYKVPKVTSGGWGSRDIPRASILNISTKRMSMVILSVLVHQMCVSDTKKLVIAYSFSFRETS